METVQTYHHSFYLFPKAAVKIECFSYCQALPLLFVEALEEYPLYFIILDLLYM